MASVGGLTLLLWLFVASVQASLDAKEPNLVHPKSIQQDELSKVEPRCHSCSPREEVLPHTHYHLVKHTLPQEKTKPHISLPHGIPDRGNVVDSWLPTVKNPIDKLLPHENQSWLDGNKPSPHGTKSWLGSNRPSPHSTTGVDSWLSTFKTPTSKLSPHGTKSWLDGNRPSPHSTNERANFVDSWLPTFKTPTSKLSPHEIDPLPGIDSWLDSVNPWLDSVNSRLRHKHRPTDKPTGMLSWRHPTYGYGYIP